MSQLGAIASVDPPTSHDPDTGRSTGPSGLASRLWNLATAVAEFVADGCAVVSSAEFTERLTICDCCDQRAESMCQACGCFLPLKARGRAMHCPLEKWPDLKTNENESSQN